MRRNLLCAAALALSLAFLGCGGGGGSASGTTSSSGGFTSSSGGTTSSSGGTTSSSSSGGPTSSSGGATDSTPPSVSNQNLSPGAFDFRGGALTITADVSDASGVFAVKATVQQVGGASTADVPLTLAQGTTYQGTYQVPANQDSTGQVQTYTVSMRATDKIGNTSSPYAVGTVTVGVPDAGQPVPPPPSWPGS